MKQNDMKQLIDDLARQAQEDAEANAREVASLKEALQKSALELVQKGLAEDGLGDLLPLGAFSCTINQTVTKAQVTWVLDPVHCDELQVCPIMVDAEVTNTDASIPRVAWRISIMEYHNARNLLAIKTVPDMLVMARKAYPGYRTSVIQFKVEEARKDMVSVFNPYFNEDADKASALHATLCEIDPSRKEVWDAELANFLDKRNEALTAKKEKDEKEAAHGKLIEAYKVDYRAWYQTCVGIHARNESRIAELQKKYDAPTTIYELTYAMVARDLGEGYLETFTSLVSRPGTKENVFHLLNGEIEKYYHPGKLRKFTVRATENGSHRAAVYFDVPLNKPDHRLYYVLGKAVKEEIEAVLCDMGFEAYPPAPAQPEELRSYEIDRVETEVFAEEEGIQ